MLTPWRYSLQCNVSRVYLGRQGLNRAQAAASCPDLLRPFTQSPPCSPASALFFPARFPLPAGLDLAKKDVLLSLYVSPPFPSLQSPLLPCQPGPSGGAPTAPTLAKKDIMLYRPVLRMVISMSRTSWRCCSASRRGTSRRHAAWQDNSSSVHLVRHQGLRPGRVQRWAGKRPPPLAAARTAPVQHVRCPVIGAPTTHAPAPNS